MKYNDSERFLISLCSIDSLAYKYKYSIYEKTCDIENLKEKVKVAKACLKEIFSKEEYNTLKNVFDDSYLGYMIEDLELASAYAITIESEDYPQSLREIENPPLILYAKGNIELLKSNCFSVVGSRKSLPLSINICEDYVKALVDGGFTLVTGIAEGVDVTVLKTALKNNGKVISVLAGGLNCIYPKSHENIFNEVAEKGLVISENTLETTAMPYMFPIRNRIIAGLSRGTLVINGSLKSGTLYTAEYAMENGRELFAVPYSVGVRSGEGTNDLIKRGAILTDKPQDILDFYGVELKHQEVQNFSEKEMMIVGAIENGVNHVELISDRLKFSVMEVKTQLSLMEIKGIVVKDGINEYSLRR